MADDKKAPGRPPLDSTDPDGTVGIHVRVPARQYDSLYQRAAAAGVSIPELVRRDLRNPGDR